MNVVVRLTLFICLQNYAYLFEILFSPSPIYHPIEHSNIYPDQKCLKYLVRVTIWSGRTKKQHGPNIS